MKKRFALCAIIIALLSLVSVASAGAPIRVVTSVAVMANLIEEIGGGQVIVNYLVTGNQCSLHYEPTTRDMITVMWADMWLGVGAGLDRWIDNIIKATGNNNITLVDASKNITLMEDVDPHIWLDPNIAIQMAENIAAALSQAKPSKAEYFQQNLDGFVLEVTNVCSKYESLFAELDDKNVVSCSGTFSYLFPAFDFNEVFVIQPIHGQEASPRAIVQAMEIIKDQNIKAIVGDAELPYAANVIAQDTNIMPLLLRSGEGNLDNLDNYIGLLEYNLRQIANIYVD